MKEFRNLYRVWVERLKFLNDFGEAVSAAKALVISQEIELAKKNVKYYREKGGTVSSIGSEKSRKLSNKLKICSI
jgi:hypothetical protein